MYLKKLIRAEKLTYKAVILFALLCGVVTGLILDVEFRIKA